MHPARRTPATKRVQLLAAFALLMFTTACGQPLTIATWLDVDPASSLDIDIGQGVIIPTPLEGGIFLRLDLDLTNPLHITGTIEAEQVRLTGTNGLTGAICIAADPDVDGVGSLSIDLLGGGQEIDFPFAITGTVANFGTTFNVVTSASGDDFDFPIDASLLEPILAAGSLEGAISLPIALEQEFQGLPALISLILTSQNAPPAISAQGLADCSDLWDPIAPELDWGMNSRGTYLRTENDPKARPPTAIDLAEIGAQPGDTLRLRRKGSFFDVNLDHQMRVAGVFSETDRVTARPAGWSCWWIFCSYDPSRVPDAIDAGSNVGTPRTFWWWGETDIAEDFEVFGVTEIVVPANASHLFLSPIDRLYGDNTSFDLRVGIEVVD